MRTAETAADTAGAAPVLFITGNSRSGTTLMMRVMNNHSQVHAINEPHFFEKLWSPSDKGKATTEEEAIHLLEKLFTGQREGFFERPAEHRHKYGPDIETLLGTPHRSQTRMELYKAFMLHEAKCNGKVRVCEKTPQNVFYIREILENFPDARIINMLRDPRGVLLSQKKKWKRRALGADFITRKEVLRLRINYHPITISQLWNSAFRAAAEYADHPRVMTVKFEDMLRNPLAELRKVCDFAGLPFEETMLAVPHAGSSTAADNKAEKGIKTDRADQTWTKRGLNFTEVSICQKICGKYMSRAGYEVMDVNPNPFAMLYYVLGFPVKLALALLFNLNRMRSIADTVKRRLSPKK